MWITNGPSSRERPRVRAGGSPNRGRNRWVGGVGVDTAAHHSAATTSTVIGNETSLCNDAVIVC